MLTKCIAKDLDGKGKGVVATTDLAPGTHVAYEYPFLQLTITTPSIDAFLDSEEQHHSSLIQSTLLKLKDKCKLAIFRSLHPPWPQEELAPQRSSTTQTNRLIERDVDCIQYNAFSDTLPNGQIWLGIYENISRFNHSCRPNANYYWDEDKGHVRVTRAAAKGEEITIIYRVSDGYQNRASRRRGLQDGYGFVCQCSACALSNTMVGKGDKVRREIGELNEMVRVNAPRNKMEKESTRYARVGRETPDQRRLPVELATLAGKLTDLLDECGIQDSRLVEALYFKTYFHLADQNREAAYAAAVAADRAEKRAYGASKVLTETMRRFEENLVVKTLELRLSG